MSKMSDTYAAARAADFDKASWDPQRAMSLELLAQISAALGGGSSPNATIKPATAVQTQLIGAPQQKLSGLAVYPNTAPSTFIKAIVWAPSTNTEPLLLAPYNAGVADANMHPVLPNQFYTLDNDGRVGDLADYGVKSAAAYAAVVFYSYPA